MHKIEKVNWERFSRLVQKLINYKTKHSRVPINAESWEEVIYVALAHMFTKETVKWDMGSHTKGVDVEVKINGDIILISAKGGKINVKNYLSISSYRLTRYNALTDKLSFLYENAKKLDVYLICSRNEDGNLLKYRIFKINSLGLVPPLFLNLSSWRETSQAWILTKHKEVGFEARIVKSMSHQLWYSIPINFEKIETLCEISLTKDELGLLLHNVLNKTD